jgi:hypothetical protein
VSGSIDVMVLETGDPRAAAVEANHTGNGRQLKRLPAEHPGLATPRLGHYDQAADFVVDRWQAGLARVGPVAAQQPPVPGQQGCRGDQPVGPDGCG